MIKITQEEIKKIARISNIEIYPDEMDSMAKHLQEVLEYAARVTEIAADVHVPSNKNINVVREDVISRTDTQPILEQAPKEQENYFVVPKIIQNN